MVHIIWIRRYARHGAVNTVNALVSADHAVVDAFSHVSLHQPPHHSPTQSQHTTPLVKAGSDFRRPRTMIFPSPVLLWIVTASRLLIASAVPSDEISPGSSKVSPNSTTCGLPAFPYPILASCTDPIQSGVPDHQGIWSNDANGHWQRIEQCGDRYVVSGPGSSGLYYIHDFPHADGTPENGVADYNAAVFPSCLAIRAAGTFDGLCMNMTVGNVVAASRCLLDDGTLEFYNQMIGTQILTRTPDTPPPSPSTNTASPTMGPTAKTAPPTTSDSTQMRFGMTILGIVAVTSFVASVDL